MSKSKIELLMEKLDLTEDEAIQLMADDKAIDKGEKLFELSQEGKQVEKQMRQADRAVNAYGKKVQRERKADNDKRAIIGRIVSTLENWFQSNEHCTFNACTEINAINPEREIEFMFNDKKYKIVLSAPHLRGALFLCILTKKFLLTFSFECGKMAGRKRTLRPEIPLYHTLSILSREKSKKNNLIIFPKTLDFFLNCAILYLRGERSETVSRLALLAGNSMDNCFVLVPCSHNYRVRF